MDVLFLLGVLARADTMSNRDKLSLLHPFEILEMQDSEQIKLLSFFFFNGENQGVLLIMVTYMTSWLGRRGYKA